MTTSAIAPLEDFLRVYEVVEKLWACVLGGLGYLFSDALEGLSGRWQRLEWSLMLAVLVLAGFLVARYLLAAKEPRRSQPEG